MDTKEIARLLNGIEYPPKIKPDIIASAKANGIVIAHGESDDLLELEGSIEDEFSANDGTTIYLTKNGLIKNDCEDSECPYFEKIKQTASKLEIVWHDNYPSWTFNCPWPHETFNIMEDGEIYCVGIVFALADVK